MSLVKGRVYRFSWGISLARIERATSSTRTFLFTRNSSLLLTPVDDDATAGSVLENEKWNKVTVYFLIQSCVVRTYFLEYFRVFEWKIVLFFSFFFFSFLREYLNWSNRRIYIYIYIENWFVCDWFFKKHINIRIYNLFFILIRVCFICINKMRREKENLIKWVEISWEITWNMKNYNYANSFIEFQYTCTSHSYL